jgi:hypothetical protein
MLLVVLEDLDLEFLADLVQFGRMRDTAPGKVGDVAESVHAAHIDEETVVGDIGDGAADDLAFLQQRAHLLAQLVALFFEDGPAGNDDVVALAVELEDLELEGLTDQRIEILDRAQIDLRIGQEAGTPISTDIPPFTRLSTLPSMVPSSSWILAISAPRP